MAAPGGSGVTPVGCRRREQTRARYPDSTGLRRARRGARVLRGLRHWRADRLAAPDLVDRPFAGTGRCQIPYLARHCRVVTFDGRGNGRSDRPAAVRRTTGGSPRDALAVMDHRGRARGGRVAGAVPGERASSSRPSTRSGSAALVLIAPDLQLSAEPAEEEGPYPFDEELATDGRLGQVQPPLLAARLTAASSSSSSAQVFTEPHSTKQIEDAIGWGLETDPETHRPRHGRGNGRNDRDSALAALRPGALPDAGHPGHGGRGRRARPAGRRWRPRPGARLVTLEGSGHAPHLRDPVARTCVMRDFALPAGAAAALAPGPGRGPSARCTSPRRSASATPSATWRSPTSCASCIPDLRDRLAGPAPGHRACWRRAASASTRPARDLASESAHIESEAAEHDLHCLPGHPADGRDPAGQLHGLPRPRPRARTTTCGSATRPGNSTTTCTRTRSRSAPPTPG